MKKLILLFLLFNISNLILAQQLYTIPELSKNYYGKIELIDTINKEHCQVYISIYETKTNKELIKVYSDELYVIENGIGYKASDLILYNDFNFDGINDFAIRDGSNGCYGDPSFKIYLADKNRFVYDEDFTELAQAYCGMFEVNYKEKKIHTILKIGLGGQKYFEFIVKNNKPKLVKIIDEDIVRKSFPYILITEISYRGKKAVEKSKKVICLEQDLIYILFQFNSRNKKIILFEANNLLHYAIIKQNKEIEFYYPSEDSDQNSNFIADLRNSDQLTVTFKNKDTTYTIYEMAADTKKEIGVKVTMNDKIVDFKGNLNSIKGSLKELTNSKVKNLHIVY